MKPWLMGLIFGRRQPVTQTFTASTTWVAPASTTRINTLVGKGEAGSPAYSGDWGYTTVMQVTIYDAQGNAIGWQASDFGRTYGTWAPASYCTTEPDGTGTRETCWIYTDFDDSRPATTGSPTTAFGKTFAGGYGGPATAVTYSSVTVTPGASYALSIASGGSVTITYDI